MTNCDACLVPVFVGHHPTPTEYMYTNVHNSQLACLVPVFSSFLPFREPLCSSSPCAPEAALACLRKEPPPSLFMGCAAPTTFSFASVVDESKPTPESQGESGARPPRRNSPTRPAALVPQPWDVATIQRTIAEAPSHVDAIGTAGVGLIGFKQSLFQKEPQLAEAVLAARVASKKRAGAGTAASVRHSSPSGTASAPRTPANGSSSVDVTLGLSSPATGSGCGSSAGAGSGGAAAAGFGGVAAGHQERYTGVLAVTADVGIVQEVSTVIKLKRLPKTTSPQHESEFPVVNTTAIGECVLPAAATALIAEFARNKKQYDTVVHAPNTPLTSL